MSFGYHIVLSLFIHAAALAATPARAAVPLDAFLRTDRFEDIKLSPDGDYFAATVPADDRTGLFIIRRADGKATASFALGKNSHVAEFWWVNPERVVMTIAQKFGQLDQPIPTGELYAINADGSKAENLVGFRVEGRGAGTRIQPKKVENVAAFPVDALAGDDRHIIIAVWPLGNEPFTRAERLDVYTGRRQTLVSAPVRRAHFLTDHAGVVRLAFGAGEDNVNKLFHRIGEDGKWLLLNDEAQSGIIEVPIGFAADNRTLYLLAERGTGPDAIVALDTADGSRRDVLRDDTVDPTAVIYTDGVAAIGEQMTGGREPVGVLLMDGKPRSAFFDEASAQAKLYRALERAFADQRVAITSLGGHPGTALVDVSSDRNPGDFFLFRIADKEAEHALSRREWLDPAALARMQPISLTARDGLVLHGYLTVPPGSAGKNLPLVVLPHGGPFGVRDVWGFDPEGQLLAAAGYAVLQVNFRGSGGYGRAFRQAGARQWGRSMQDDLTDATRWAIAEGIADAGRICIYGASYGAYAALTGAAREPDLYRCAIGYVGVYDLPLMHRRGDIQDSKSGRRWRG
jgi:dipeptidyl aminopeptidase/acylaminoacyl peptidase